MRRACINSFGYSGTNATVVLDGLEEYISQTALPHISFYISDSDDFFSENALERPHLLVFSANDETSLKDYCRAVSRHLINPRVNINLSDLAYTSSQRRSRHYYRAYAVARCAMLDVNEIKFGKPRPRTPRVGFIFTGQGAQWPRMGNDIIETSPALRSLVKKFGQCTPVPFRSAEMVIIR